MSRACANWLTEYSRWTLPRSEAPESYIFWTGLFTLAAALRRRVLVSKKKLGSWDAYPYMYIMLIAPPGKARKTTTLNYAETLLDGMPGVNMASSTMTVQVMLKNLSEYKEASLSILSGEFSNFVYPSKMEMLDTLTNMFDGKSKHTYETILRNVELADKPCVNLLAATTPKYIAEEMPGAAVEGGFFSRLIPIYEEKVRRRQLFYENLDYEALDCIEMKLKQDLLHLASTIEGEFDFELDAKEWAEQWYRKNADIPPVDESGATGYHERKPAYLFKVAMLLHLAYSDELVLTLEDLQKALTLLEQIERKMSKAFRIGGKNPYVTEMDAMIDYVTRKGRVTKKVMLDRFAHVAAPVVLNDLIGGLIAAGKLEVDMKDPNNICYRAAKE